MAEDDPLAVICTLGLAGVMTELRARFEETAGRPLAIRFGPTAALAKEIEAGAAFDVAVLTAPAIEAFAAAGPVAPGTRVDLARSCVGVTVTPGLPQPDIGTAAAFTRALAAARRVCYTLNGASGKHFAGLLPRLGIEDEVKRKALVIDGLVAERVVRGDADLGIQQVSEIRAVPGAVLVGPIPEELNVHTVFAAGLAARSRNAAAARALIDALASEETRAVALAKGLDRV
jgi:molybdate transport system substrate-binding protein